MANSLRITLRRSLIGTSPKQRLHVKGLGLKRIGHSVVRENTPSVRGQVKKIIHLVAVEEVSTK